MRATQFLSCHIVSVRRIYTTQFLCLAESLCLSHSSTVSLSMHTYGHTLPSFIRHSLSACLLVVPHSPSVSDTVSLKPFSLSLFISWLSFFHPPMQISHSKPSSLPCKYRRQKRERTIKPRCVSASAPLFPHFKPSVFFSASLSPVPSISSSLPTTFLLSSALVSKGGRGGSRIKAAKGVRGTRRAGTV